MFSAHFMPEEKSLGNTGLDLLRDAIKSRITTMGPLAEMGPGVGLSKRRYDEDHFLNQPVSSPIARLGDSGRGKKGKGRGKGKGFDPTGGFGKGGWEWGPYADPFGKGGIPGMALPFMGAGLGFGGGLTLGQQQALRNMKGQPSGYPGAAQPSQYHERPDVPAFKNVMTQPVSSKPGKNVMVDEDGNVVEDEDPTCRGIPKTEPPKEGPFKLFVGNLPKDVTEEMIQTVFKTYGKVKEIFVMQGTASTKGQACAFVEYETEYEAKVAVATLAGKYEIRPGEGPITVRHASTNLKEKKKAK